MVDHKAEDRAEENKAKTGPRKAQQPDFYTQELDPTNFGKEVNPQHIAMFNGVQSLDADPARSVDSGVRVRAPLSETSDVELELARSTTALGAQGKAIASAPDTPEKNAVAAETPMVAPHTGAGPQEKAAKAKDQADLQARANTLNTERGKEAAKK